jgi:multidrug efflux pump subunit AcrA (membrane-fusion protein)
LDIVREKNARALWKRPVFTVSCFGIVLALVFYYSYSLSSVDFTIDSDQVVIAKVEQGPMTVSVSGNGILVPEEIYWLASRVSGRVEKVLVQAGDKVEYGQPLFILSNPQLIQLRDESQWSYQALLAEQEALDSKLATDLLNHEAVVLSAKLALDKARLTLSAQNQLIQSGNDIVSQIDFKESQLDVAQMQQTLEIEQRISKQFEENAHAQRSAMSAQVNKLAKTLERAEEQVTSLTLKASIAGVIQESQLEQGQQLQAGTNIAKIATPDKLYAQIGIPELLATRLALGQAAKIDSRRGIMSGVVRRIDPNISNGNVVVDIEIESDLAPNARPDLSVVGEVTISQLAQTLHVRRPAFSQENQRATLFKVDTQGFAIKVKATLGQASSHHIQIASGLNAGDRIIVSDTTDWSSFDTLRIN